jgi:nicotinamidase-related amidase
MKQETIVGKPAIVVIDIFESDFSEEREFSHGIPSMPDNSQRMAKAAEFVKKGRDAGLPIIVIHEIHRPDLIDFGRELDGSEDIHCIQDPKNPQLPVKGIGMTDKDYVVYKRRYSAFYSTDLEILLKGLGVSTLILVGGMTDVCVQYTFVDGHQGDYYCRTLSDCVSGTSIEAHNSALNAMEYLQEGSVMTSENMLKIIDTYQKS